MAKVVVGMSGGVDSSVAAWLLKQQGHEVVALFMINWHDTTGTLSGDCPWNDDLIFAELVARKLEIPFHTVDLSEHYRTRVVDYMFAEYEKGRTPNPDVLCNREIKFDLFIQSALDLGADYIATGHYCRKEELVKDSHTIYRLLAGSDPNKDQSYFLCQLSQKQLEKVLFPIGHLIKPEVRRIADEVGLATSHRKDSQGICFVGKVDLPVFLQQKLSVKKGEIIEIPESLNLFAAREAEIENTKDENDKLKLLAEPYYYRSSDGKAVGVHNGAHFFTIGQRKGLNVGGTKEALFVIATDIENNIIYTGQGDGHPGLNRRGLFVPLADIHWIREDLRLKPEESQKVLLRIRYRQPLQNATLRMKENGLYIIFDKLQRGITSGQFAAWYDGEELLGSGVIA
jgi:tRNA-uridine 2-sulfurtransferase